jgi:hypothetical protein
MRVVDLLAQVFSLYHRLWLLLEKEQAREDVDVGLDDEAFHRQVDAGQHPTVPKDPVPDVFVTRIAQHTIWQDDAHSPTRLEPLDATLDEEDFRCNGWLGVPCFLLDGLAIGASLVRVRVVAACSGTAVSHPGVNVVFFELPETTNLVAGHTLVGHPGVDRVLGNAQVFSDFVYR